MKLIRPTAAEAEPCLRAMKSVLIADGVINPIEEKLLAAAQTHILGTDFDVDRLKTISPAELAAAVTRPALRRQLVGAMVVNSFASGQAGPEQLAAVEGFAAALGAEVAEVESLRKYARHHLALLRFDVIRHMYIGDAIGRIWHDEGFKGMLATLGGLAGLGTDDAMAAPYRALGELPEGTLGHAVFHHYRSHGFPFPGERYGGPPAIVLHDVAHVLGGYGVEPDGEFEVAAFTAGFRGAQSFSILLFVLCQFDLGVRMAPIAGAGATVGLLDPDRFLAALVRGSQMTVDLFDGWDLWAAVDQPLDAVRRACGVPPRG